MENVYGIDLGTTFCACGSIGVGNTDARLLDLGGMNNPALASEVFLSESAAGDLRADVGEVAGQRRIEEPDKGEYIEAAKRYIGADAGRTWFFGDEEFDPVDVSALILRKIAARIEYATGAREIRAVVTHPRDFTMPRREATKRAVDYAGIDLVDTLHEPVAAAYAYFEPGATRNGGNYMVFDLGGGTLDIAVLEVPSGDRDPIRVAGGYGVANLGGCDWDDAMYREIIENLKSRHVKDDIDFDYELSDQTAARLQEIAIDWKIQSAHRSSFQRRIDLILEDGAEITTLIEADRQSWRERCQGLLEDCEEAIAKAIQKSGIVDFEIDEVLPVGGSVQLEMVRELLDERFGQKVVSLNSARYSPQLAVAQGAARFASYYVSSNPSDSADSGAVDEEHQEMLEESMMVTSLPHGITIPAMRDGKKWFSSLMAEGTELPAECSKTYQIPAGMETVEVPIYEGSEGEYQAGIPESANLKFPADLGPEPGDRVTFVIEAKQSAQIEVTARHEPTGRSKKISLETGAGGEGGERSGSRKAFLQAIEIR